MSERHNKIEMNKRIYKFYLLFLLKFYIILKKFKSERLAGELPQMQ